MLLEFNGQTQVVESPVALREAIRVRDSRGGAQFWISEGPRSFSCLAVRVSGDLADAHYFPDEGHPGFRCLASSPPDRSVLFVFEGCDPGVGERVPAEFVLSLGELDAVVSEFASTQRMCPSSSWLEL